MSNNLNAILEAPIFKEAANLAKALANQKGETALSSAAMLAGIYFAVSPKSSDYPDIVVKMDEIKEAISNIGIDPSTKMDTAKVDKMPLSEGLKDILSASEGSFSIFVDKLINSIVSITSFSNTDYLQMLAYASCICETQKINLVTPKIFSVSAYIAFTQGEFTANQALSGFFNANYETCEVLISELNINREIKPAADQPLMPLATELISAIASEGTDGERIFAAINIGLRPAQLALSEAATAYHEAGHAVVSATLRPSLSVTKLTIVQKGDADGTTFFDSSSTYWQQPLTREDLLATLATALAGRAAQLVKFGQKQIDVGASTDIEEATSIAWRSIALAGLDPELGPVNLEAIGKLQGDSRGWIFDLAQQRVQLTLSEAAERAEKILRANWSQVESVAEELLSKKTLSEVDFAKNFVETTLVNHPGIKKATSRLSVRKVNFANYSGILQTPDGPVRYNIGDPIITEANGFRWPVSKMFFDKHYRPEGMTIAGSDGNYSKMRQEVICLELFEEKRLDLSNGKGILYGRAGDWMIDYGNGDLSIVSKDQFPRLYELIQNEE